jgi:hypothetical protein
MSCEPHLLTLQNDLRAPRAATNNGNRFGPQKPGKITHQLSA